MAKNHSQDKSDRCKHKTVFSVTQSLMLLLQKSTKMQTHEIMKVLIDQYEGMVKDYELDLNSKKSGAKWGRGYWNSGNHWISKETRFKKTITFPNTNVIMSCNMMIWYHPNKGSEYKPGCYTYKKENELYSWGVNTNVVKVNFIMPQTKLYFDSDKIGELMLEGELFDVSEDIGELKTKDTPTPAEKRAKKEAKKQETIKKKMAKLNDKLAKGKKLTELEQSYYDEHNQTSTESNKP